MNFKSVMMFHGNGPEVKGFINIIRVYRFVYEYVEGPNMVKKAQLESQEDDFLDWALAIGLTEAVRSRGKASKEKRRDHKVTR